MTPFQLAWDFLKADSKDPHELRTQQFQEGIQGLRDLFNQPSPDNFNPITAIEGVRNEDDLIERSMDSGWNQAQDAMAWDEFERRNTTNRSERDEEVVQEADSSKGQELMNRLMSGETLSTDELTHLIEHHEGFNQNNEPRNTTNRSERDEEAVREFVNRQPQKPNFGIPVNTEQTRLRFGRGGYEPTPLDLKRDKDSFDRLNPTGDDRPNPPYRVGDTPHRVDSEGMLQRAEQRFKNKQAAAKLHLQNNPPRLERDEGISADGNLYNIMSGNKDLGNVGIDDTGGIGYGEVKPTYQRQGLYGKTLQAIINERNVLHSTGNRNQNSQPFHEQFNPPNTGKHVTGYLGGNHLPHDNGTDRYTYRALPPQETPENWGALEYDTGALPIYQQKPAEERNAISPRGDSKQRNLEDYWGLDQRYNPQYSFDDQQANNLRIPRTD